MKLKWTRTAAADLAEIQDYIEKQRPASARRVALVILEQAESLLDNPRRGRSGQVEGIRELVIGKYPYFIVYRLHGDEIQLLRVMHDRRQWPSDS